MNLEPMELIAATEAMSYNSVKPNFVYRNQKSMYLPRGQTKFNTNGVVFLITPNREVSMDVINSKFMLFYKSGYKFYSTPVRYAERVGSHQIRGNKRSIYRREFNENKEVAIRFKTPEELNRMIDADQTSFIYDLGAWHERFFTNRYFRTTKSICQDYMDFLNRRIGEVPCTKYDNKVILIPLDKWFKHDSTLGIRKRDLTNPLSIILLCMYRFPELLTQLTDGFTLILTDEASGCFMKTTIDSTDKKTCKLLYMKLKMQFKKMNCFKVIDEIEAEVEAEATPKEDEEVETFINVTRRLVGNTTTKTNAINTPHKVIASSATNSKPNNETSSDTIEKPKRSVEPTVKSAPKQKKIDIFNIDKEIGNDSSIEDIRDDIDINNQEIDEEISNTVATALSEDESLADGTYTEREAEDIIEDKVKRQVFISKFVPERSARLTAKLESYARKQEEVIKQTVPEMKSKLIDTSHFEEVLTEVHNENIKSNKFTNFDKSYIDKKLKPDLVSCVSKMSEAEIPIFIENIEIEDTSDVLNQQDTYTFHLVDEFGKKHKIVLDIPKIIDNTYVYLGGNRRTILKQRLNRPIVKIAPDTVDICTWYNKCRITRYGQAVDSKTTAIGKAIMGKKHYLKYKVVFGNARVRNKGYRTSLDFDYYARKMVEATIGNTRFIFDLNKLEETLKSFGVKEDIVIDDKLACGYTTSPDGKITVVRCRIDGKNITGDEGINDVILSKLSPSERSDIKLNGSGGQFAYARMKILAKYIPVAFFMLYCVGFSKMMSTCGIAYDIYDNTKENRKHDWGIEKGTIETMDKIIVYDKYPYENSLLMNGLKGLPFHSYSFTELDSKDTYIGWLNNWFSTVNIAPQLDQFKDFLLDDAAKEMLMDFNQPTELIPLLFYAVQLLVNNQYVSETDMTSVRIRSTEIIPNIMYDCVANAYGVFRKSRMMGGSAKINLPRNSVIKALSQSSILDDASVTNPVMSLEKSHTCTVKASTPQFGINLGGQNQSNGMTMARRAYDPTMVGVFGITCTPDAEVGIKRFLTIEPNITSTRGYIESTADQDLDNLNSANLFTFAESLTPPGVRHDDPPRTGMMYSQTSHMVMVDDSTPVLIGNHVESVVPYHMNGDFCFVAKKPGVIHDIKRGIYVVKYDDGTFDSFDTNPVIYKNSSEGAYTEVKFTCKHDIGYRFKKNEVLAMEPRAFTQDENGLTASMNIGVLAKVAIVSSYDIYEDSEPITKKLSERLGTTVIHMKPVTLLSTACIDYIVKIGDRVNTGDPLIKFDNNTGDENVDSFMEAIRKLPGVAEKINESVQPMIKTDESGVIEDIRVYSTVPVDALSPTLQKLIKEYHIKLETKANILEKYRNEGDNNFYKCGQLINETTDPVNAVFGKVKGSYVGEGVLIEIYIKSRDIIKKGDKNTNYCALKGVTSHVIPEGQEPFSESRPDEEISAFIAPLSILSRKTPSIFTNLFGNKVLIELKRKLKEDYLSD